MNENIKDIIEILELVQDDLKSNNENVSAILDYEDLKALQNLYDLYKKQEVQINHLIQKTINYDKTIEKLQKDTIWKDKIRTKIEELESVLDLLQQEKVAKYKITSLKEEIEDFKEIIKEE